MKLKIVGLIWYKNDPNQVIFSCETINGEFCHAKIPILENILKEEARQSGKDLSDIVDIYNDRLEHEEEKRRANNPLAMSFKFQSVTKEQADFIFGNFNLNWEPESRSERSDKVDGSHE